MKVTYFGHSCFLADVRGKKLLFDPFITGNELAASVDVDAIEADYVLISHAHVDHVLDAERILKRTGAVLISNFEIVQHFKALGVEKTHPMNHGGDWDFEFGRVKYVTAVHSSSFPDGSYGGNPGGFVIESGDTGDFYYSGDTALTLDMKLINELFQLEWAALCIGDCFTMGVSDAVRAADFAGVRRVLGVHYDTMPEIKIDHDKARAAFHAADKELHLPGIGQTIEL